MSRLLLTDPLSGLLAMLDASASPILAAHDRKMAMQRKDPVLAALYRIEAIGDGRLENDQTADAQLATCRRLAREAIEHLAGRPFSNPLYPTREDK